MRTLIAVLTVVFTFSLIVAIGTKYQKRKESFRDRLTTVYNPRLAQMQKQAQAGKKPVKKASAKDRFLKFVREHSKKLPRIKIEERLNAMMERADWPLLGRDFEVIALLTGIVVALVLMLVTMQPLIAFLGFPAGIFLAWVYLQMAIGRRQKAFMNQLGGMLEMTANALRSGFSFIQAFELIAREMDPPIGRESQKVLREMNLGATLETALTHMQDRVQSPDFELVVTAVLIQRQVGGNLADILDTISYTIQERVRMRREVMALTAQGRLTGIVLAALPFALGTFLYTCSPGYLDPLFDEPIGHMLIAGGIVMIIIGFVVIRKIVDIKA